MNQKYMMKFKSQYTFELRLQESTRILNKYKDKIPIICEKINKNQDIPMIDKIKYLVPTDLTIGQFLFVIRNRMKLPPEKGIFLFVGNTIPPSSSIIAELYDQFKDKDGFLYVMYSGENIFG